MFESCTDTSYGRQFPPIATCAGFLDYQTDVQSIGHGLVLNFSFTDKSTPADAPRLVLSPLNCSSYVLPGSNETQSCPCSTCAASCAALHASPALA
jgi:hypothetical protein